MTATDSIVPEPGKMSVLLVYTLRSGQKKARDLKHNVTDKEAKSFTSGYNEIETQDRNVVDAQFVTIPTTDYVRLRK